MALQLPHDSQGRASGPAIAAFAVLLLAMTGHALLETARDALFLASIPANRLPWTYLGIAGLSLLLMEAQKPVLRRVSGAVALCATLVAGAVVTLAFWLLLRSPSTAALYALYIWPGVLATLLLVQFWLAISNQFTVTEAKRLYSFIGSGAVLGALLGSGLAGLLARAMPARHLLGVAAGAFVLAAFVPAIFLRLGEEPASGEEDRSLPSSLLDDLRALRAQPYPRSVARMVIMSAAALTLADYLFKATVADKVPADQLGSFFATTYFVLNALSLAVQVLVVGRVVRSVGITASILVLPVLMAVGGVGLLIGGGLGAAMLLKGADGTLKHTLHRTSVELLFVPMIDRVRSQVKRVIDVLGNRGGQALASSAILVAARFGAGPRELSVGLLLLLLFWLLLARALYRPYLEVFRKTLRDLAVDTRRLEFPTLDQASVEGLMEALNSPEDARVVAALQVLENQGKAHLVPALILYHPSEAVVVQALDLFAGAGNDSFVAVADRLVGEATPVLHAALVRARTAVRPDESFLRKQVDSFCSSTRSTAAVFLYAFDWLDDEHARERFELVMQGENHLPRLAMARAAPHGFRSERALPVLEEFLVRLAGAPEYPVRQAALEAMALTGQRCFLPTMLDALTDQQTLREARDALIAFGATAIPEMAKALADPQTPHEARRELPRLLQAIDARAVAPILTEQLEREEDGLVEYRVIRALEQVLQADPSARLDGAVLDRMVDRTVAASFQLLRNRMELEEGDREQVVPGSKAHRLLVRLLRDKEEHAIERLVRLIGLHRPREDFGGIFRGLRSPLPKARASSLELLEAFVRPSTRRAVLGIVGVAPDGERLAAGAGFVDPEIRAYSVVLDELLTGDSETLRGLASAQVAGLGLMDFRPKLEAMGAGTGTFLQSIVQDALAQLGAAREEVAHG